MLSLNIVSLHGNHKNSIIIIGLQVRTYCAPISCRSDSSGSLRNLNKKGKGNFMKISAAIKSRKMPPEASRYRIISHINSKTPKWTNLCYFHHLPVKGVPLKRILVTSLGSVTHFQDWHCLGGRASLGTSTCVTSAAENGRRM